MTIHLKALTTAVLAALMLTFAAGTASALRSLSIGGVTTLTLNGRISFSSEFSVIEMQYDGDKNGLACDTKGRPYTSRKDYEPLTSLLRN
jgi:hypothetical protein